MAGTPLWPPASVTRPDLRAESKSERPREVWAVLRGSDAHDQPLRNTRAYTPTSTRPRWNTHTSLEDIVELPTRDDEAEDVAVRSLEDNLKGLLSQAPKPRPTTHEFKPLQPAVQSSPCNFGEANHILLADQKQVSMAANHLEGNMSVCCSYYEPKATALLLSCHSCVGGARAREITSHVAPSRPAQVA